MTETEGGARSGAQSAPIAGPSVVLIEDEPQIRRFLRAVWIDVAGRTPLPDEWKRVLGRPRREVVAELSFHGDLFRFISILALQKGFRVIEIRSVSTASPFSIAAVWSATRSFWAVRRSSTSFSLLVAWASVLTPELRRPKPRAASLRVVWLSASSKNEACGPSASTCRRPCPTTAR
jgi:hypothetical protein